MPVSVDVDGLEFGSRIHWPDQWLDRPPQRCTRGHWLLPGHMIVGTISCSCGTHICWECECGAATYGPALRESCSVLGDLASTRRLS